MKTVVCSESMEEYFSSLQREVDSCYDVARRARMKGLDPEIDVEIPQAADLVIFVFDPTETCGYPMSEQEHLLRQIREQFSSIPIIEVENKADLTKSKDERMKISASTGYNVTKLVDRIVAALKAEQPL